MATNNSINRTSNGITVVGTASINITAVDNSTSIGNATGSSPLTLSFGSGGWTVSPFTTTGALVSSASGVITDASASTAGYVLTSNGASSVPTFQAPASGGISTLNGNTGSATGSTVTIAGSGVISTSGASATITITSSAANSIATGSGTATASSNAFTISGTSPISTSGSGSTVTITTTAASSFSTDSGTATPSTNSITITGSGTVSTSASGSTITITGTAGFTIINQNTSSVTMAVNKGYLINNGASLVTLTLPTTAAVGSAFQIIGSSAGGWSVAQNSGQTIHFGNVNTTTGATGSLSSSNQYDQLYLVCNVANTDFVVTSAIGNITYV